jgi:nucleotide-binding universal stress UspA family protein
VRAEFEAFGVQADAELACGTPPAKQIVKWVQENGCDLVAMSTHGHRWLSDLLHGTTACEVRHCLNVPVLLLKAQGIGSDRNYAFCIHFAAHA